MSKTGKISIAAIVALVAATASFLAVLAFGTNLRAYTVQGGSMEPAYQAGDLIITTTSGAERVQPGEIIVFIADWASAKYENRVVHRVSAVGTIQGLPVAYTRGDANNVADPRPVDLTGDVRVVMFSIPAGGTWLEMPIGPFAIAVLATLGAGIAGLILLTGLPAIGRGQRQPKVLSPQLTKNTLLATDLVAGHQHVAQSLRLPAPALPVRRIK